MINIEESSNKSHSKSKTNKLIIVVVCIAVILVATFVGIYYCVLPSQPTQKGEVVTNFSDGVWANYTANFYDKNGNFASQGNMMTYTTAGTYNGQDCWVYVENVTYTSTDGAAINDVITYYLDKSTYSTLHQTEQVTSDGLLA